MSSADIAPLRQRLPADTPCQSPAPPPPLRPHVQPAGRFSLVRSFALADFLTLGNGACGFLAILSCLRHLSHPPLLPAGDGNWNLWWAMALLPLGGFLDVMDGRVARWRNQSSILGQELDSLADLITFAVAPAVLGYTLGLRTHLDAVILTSFVACVLARLARYNATVAALPKAGGGKIRYFEGTPAPTSLFIVLLMVYELYMGRVGAGAATGDAAWSWWESCAVPGLGAEVTNLSWLFLASGTAMVSRTLRIPKL